MTPRLVYDGDCGFCRYTVDYARALTGDGVEYLPYQAVAGEYPSLGAADFARSIWLFEAGPDGPAASGADAAFRTLALGGRRGWRWVYRHVPGFAWVAERGYDWVARHREGCLRIARPLFGRELAPARLERTADIVYRGIAACAVMAFVSLWLQGEALIGDNGVLPAGEFLEAVKATYGVAGYWSVPTVLWLGVPLHWVFAFGTLCAVVALAGKLRTCAALGAYASYLSTVTKPVTEIDESRKITYCLTQRAFVGLSASLCNVAGGMSRFRCWQTKGRATAGRAACGTCLASFGRLRDTHRSPRGPRHGTRLGAKHESRPPKGDRPMPALVETGTRSRTTSSERKRRRRGDGMCGVLSSGRAMDAMRAGRETPWMAHSIGDQRSTEAWCRRTRQCRVESIRDGGLRGQVLPTVRTRTAHMDDFGSFRQLCADRVMMSNRLKGQVGGAFGRHASLRSVGPQRHPTHYCR